MRKTCQIVGFDGSDSCIETMAASFYIKAGYDVKVGVRSPTNCDLLVILRGAIPTDLNLSFYSLVHLYGYAWSLDSAYTNLLDGVIHKVIVPHSSYLPKGYSDRYGDANVIFSYPPVIPDFWYKKSSENIMHDYVHIGNYKKNQSDDVAAGFVHNLRENGVTVYGNGWEGILPSHLLMGPLEMGRVSEVYSSSKAGLGIMYPYQRKFSFSGRFFQAPLAGVPLFTECLPLLSACPGLHQVDWTKSVHLSSDFNLISGSHLSDMAYLYWRDMTIALSDKLGVNLLARLFPASSFTDARKINNLFI